MQSSLMLLVVLSASFAACKNSKFSGDNKRNKERDSQTKEGTLNNSAFEDQNAQQQNKNENSGSDANKGEGGKLVTLPVIRQCTLLNGLFSGDPTVEGAKNGIVMKYQKIVDPKGKNETKILAQDAMQMKNDIINSGKINIQLEPGQYAVIFCDKDKAGCSSASEFYSEKNTLGNGNFTLTPDFKIKNSYVKVVYKRQSVSGKECDDINSPLVVDYENTGIKVSSITDGVSFDITGDGNAEQSAWPSSAGAAFIALDRNGDGKINDIHELFGNRTRGEDAKYADNGFLALQKYDGNGDTIISAEDKIFNELRFWFDSNHNGVSEKAELMSLQDAGVNHIDLNYSEILEIDTYGNQTRQRSVIMMRQGGYRMIFDIWFRHL